MNRTLPCVVLGLETQIGLNIVRELGRAGVPVIGVAQNPHAIGLRSRHLWRSLVAMPPRSPEMLDTLARIGREHGPCPLISIAEINMLWLQQHAAAIAPLVPVLAPKDALAAVLDKRRTLEAARSVGMDVPRTWQPQSLEDIEANAPSFPFPAVLKWGDANAVAPLLAGAGIEFVKSEYADTPQELRHKLGRYAAIGQWPLVQQYCAGHGLGQFFYMKDGQAIRRFQHRRVAEWPPEGGTSSVADAVPLSQHHALQEKSVELLRLLGWRGVAMVEFRHDPATGRSWLMEINGRFWGSFPLAVHAGAGFALLSYLDYSAQPIPTLPEPRSDLRARMLGLEFRRLIRVLLKPGLIADPHFERKPAAELARFVFDFLRPTSRYFVGSWDDPAPLLADLANIVRRR